MSGVQERENEWSAGEREWVECSAGSLVCDPLNNVHAGVHGEFILICGHMSKITSLVVVSSESSGNGVLTTGGPSR